MLEPRLMTRDQAATYCGLSRNQFSNWVRDGLVPPPIARTKRWDRHAIDQRLDQLSGLAVQSALSPLEQWKADRDARRHGT